MSGKPKNRGERGRERHTSPLSLLLGNLLNLEVGVLLAVIDNRPVFHELGQSPFKAIMPMMVCFFMVMRCYIGCNHLYRFCHYEFYCALIANCIGFVACVYFDHIVFVCFHIRSQNTQLAIAATHTHAPTQLN